MGREGEGRPAPVLCACGCGGQAGGFYRRNKFHPARYIRGHNRKGQVPVWTVPAVRAYQDASCVPAEPVISLVRARGMTGKDLALVSGLDRRTAYKVLHQQRIRRATAERIIRALAGLPRPPSLTERRLTDYRERARYREMDADRRKEYRAKEKAS